MQDIVDVSIIILTKDEERNLPYAIKSVLGWARSVCILDSFSQDKTLEIALKNGCSVLQNKFVNYSSQRNFALENFNIESEWIFFLDADEYLSENLKDEIKLLIQTNPKENGFFVRWKMIWMGANIHRGYYGTWILRLCRKQFVKCEERPINEHLIVDGETGYLKSDFIHEDHKHISDWILKHNRYSDMEARELLKTLSSEFEQEIDVNLFGTQAQRKRWVRYKLWNKMPEVVRPIIYFLYRYILKRGFLDGKVASIYHFFHALWYPLLIDAKYIELREKSVLSDSCINNDSMPTNENIDIAVIILTNNDEVNLPQALSSIKGWAREICVLDSYSNDNTLKIAKDFGCNILQNEFQNFKNQQNFGMNNFTVKSAWRFILNADEWLSNELKNEITELLKSAPREGSFYIPCKTIWLNKTISGHFPPKMMRLYKNADTKFGFSIEREEYLFLNKTKSLRNSLIQQNHKSLNELVLDYNKNASMEAYLAYNMSTTNVMPRNYLPSSIKIWGSFFKNYFLSMAFLKGSRAFLYYFFNKLWYPILVRIKYKELSDNK